MFLQELNMFAFQHGTGVSSMASLFHVVILPPSESMTNCPRFILCLFQECFVDSLFKPTASHPKVWSV